MATTPTGIVPTVHLNGTSKTELLDTYAAAVRAVEAAIDRLYAAMPNDRDYYVQGPGAGIHARTLHVQRITKLTDVRDELAVIEAGIYEQGR